MTERTPADYPTVWRHQDVLNYCWCHPDYANNPLAPEFLARYTACEALLVSLQDEIPMILGPGRGPRLIRVYESIRNEGYWPEVPVIAHPYSNWDGHLAVVPGNERLCALRALKAFDPETWERVLPNGMVPVRLSLPGDVVDDNTPADTLFERPI